MSQSGTWSGFISPSGRKRSLPPASGSPTSEKKRNSERDPTPVHPDRLGDRLHYTAGLLGLLVRVGGGLIVVPALTLLLVLGSVLGFIEPGGYGTTTGDVRRLTSPDAGFPRTLTWFLHGRSHVQA